VLRATRARAPIGRLSGGQGGSSERWDVE
jgi:hypothetical protein